MLVCAATHDALSGYMKVTMPTNGSDCILIIAVFFYNLYSKNGTLVSFLSYIILYDQGRVPVAPVPDV